MTRESAKMRIIGIDPGYAITGYGIIDKTGSKFEVVDYGAIETKAGVDFPLRLLAINDKIRFLLEQYKPDYMSIEELFMGHNHTTVIDYKQATVHVEEVRVRLAGKLENAKPDEDKPAEEKPKFQKKVFTNAPTGRYISPNVGGNSLRPSRFDDDEMIPASNGADTGSVPKKKFFGLF